MEINNFFIYLNKIENTPIPAKVLQRNSHLIPKYLEENNNTIEGPILDIDNENPEVFPLLEGVTINGNLHLFSTARPLSIPDNLTVKGKIFISRTVVSNTPLNLKCKGIQMYQDVKTKDKGFFKMRKANLQAIKDLKLGINISQEEADITLTENTCLKELRNNGGEISFIEMYTTWL